MISQAIQLLQSGGSVMIPLFAVSVFIYWQAFQLLGFVFRGQKSLLRAAGIFANGISDDAAFDANDLLAYAMQKPLNQVIVRARFDEIRLAYLSVIDRRLRLLQTLTTAAPLIGLLGTVVGILMTFDGLAGQGMQYISLGVSKALVTTQCGLIVALPALFFAMMIQRRKHSIVAELAKLENAILLFTRTDLTAQASQPSQS